MRKFLKRRWHSIPVSLVSALLILVLIAGGALAGFAGWFTFTTGKADITVVEAIEVVGFTGHGSVTGDQAGGYTWTVSLYPGESRSLFPSVKNLSSSNLELVTDVGTVPAGLTVVGHGDISLEIPAPIAGGATASFEIKVTADGSIAPGTYSIYFDFCRQ